MKKQPNCAFFHPGRHQLPICFVLDLCCPILLFEGGTQVTEVGGIGEPNPEWSLLWHQGRPLGRCKEAFSPTQLQHNFLWKKEVCCSKFMLRKHVKRMSLCHTNLKPNLQGQRIFFCCVCRTTEELLFCRFLLEKARRNERQRNKLTSFVERKSYSKI